MDALALYLWHLLRSRDETDSDEEVVELPQVKLPEITVIRKNEERRRDETSRKRKKRVTFAEPLQENGSVTGDSLKSSTLADHYTLVPVDTDHDYIRAPLVCYRRLPGGEEVKMPVEVKSRYEVSEKADPPASQKQMTPKRTQISPNNSESSPTRLVKEGPAVQFKKTYKPVHDWNELLEQFDTKPEDGDTLFDGLIRALGGTDEKETSDYERESDEDDNDVCDETYENDSNSNSVEIIWENEAVNSVTPTNQSDKEPLKNAYHKHFGKFAEEELAPVEFSSGYLKKLEGTSGQSLNVSESLKDSSEQPDRTQQAVVSAEPLNTALAGVQSIEVFVKIENSRNEQSDNSPIEHSDSSAIELGSFIKQESIPTQSVPGRKRRPARGTEKTGDQPKLKRKKVPPKDKKERRNVPRPFRIKPVELLSKKQIMSRLAREIRSSQDPRDMLDGDTFKTAFGVSKDFANFLINSLTPHLPVPEKSRSSRTPAHLKVLTTLHFFAVGSRHRELRLVTHMSQPQVCRSLQEVIDTLIMTAPEPELPSSDSEFSELYGLPDIIGAVDATHVPIRPPDGIGRKCPGKERFSDPTVYKNSANYYSINVEIVSSSSNRVLFCNANHTGNSTKSDMWCKSKVRELMIARHVKGSSSDKLIAGSGYDCEPWMLTPCSVTYSHSPEQKYNASLLSALQDSTRLTIGLLKGRFKCLSTASKTQVLYYSPAKACKVVTACCILHNLAMDFGEEMPEPIFDESDLAEGTSDSNQPSWDGLEMRNSYILEHFC